VKVIVLEREIATLVLLSEIQNGYDILKTKTMLSIVENLKCIW